MKRFIRFFTVAALILVMVGPAWAVRTPVTVGRTAPDYIDVTVRNVCRGGTSCILQPGDVVVWVPNATNPGKDVSKINIANSNLVAGVIVGDAAGNSADTASGDLATMRIFGYYPFVKVSGSPINGTLVGTSSTEGEAAAGNGLGTVIDDSVSGAPTKTEGVMIRTIGNWGD